MNDCISRSLALLKVARVIAREHYEQTFLRKNAEDQYNDKIKNDWRADVAYEAAEYAKKLSKLSRTDSPSTIYYPMTNVRK